MTARVLAPMTLLLLSLVPQTAAAENFSLGVRGGGAQFDSETSTGLGVYLRFSPVAYIDFAIAYDKYTLSDAMDSTNTTLGGEVRIKPPLTGPLNVYILAGIARNTESMLGIENEYKTVDLGLGIERSFGLLEVGGDVRYRSRAIEGFTRWSEYEGQGAIAMIYAGIKF